MGFLLTLLLAMVFGALGLMRPKLAFSLLLALFVLFDEMGPGFTTFRGSWVFNAYFVGFAGFRLIEVLIAATYIPFILVRKDRRTGTEPFRMERMIFPILAIWVVMLTALEFVVSKSITVYSWRLIVTAAMLFHMLMLLYNTTDERIRLLRYFLILLTVKCAWGLLMWAAGNGVMSPRGRLPFFWDSRQIEAFALGAVILTAYMLNFHAIEVKQRIIPFFWAFVMWAIMLSAVAGSIRRTIWVSTFLCLLLVLVLSKRTTIVHYFSVIMLSAVTVGALLLLPGLEDFRKHMGRYVASMNLFDSYQRQGNIENDVHISNLQSYSKMLLDNPDIMAVGRHGFSGNNVRDLMAQYAEDGYRLGMAHNGPMRSMLSFGIVGLIIYLWLYFNTVRRSWLTWRDAPEDQLLKHVGLACGCFLALEFTATMTFVPPFYTSSKGLFYTFWELYFVGISALMALRARQAAAAKVPGSAASLRAAMQMRGR
jgi:hypothetical protein